MIKQLIKDFLAYFGVSVKPRFRKPLIGKNATVEYAIGKYTITLNRLHVLPFIAKYHPEYDTNLPRIAKFLAGHIPALVAMDIGANVGDTAAYIKNAVDIPVICIEGNDLYFNLLQQNTRQMPGVSAFKTYLGESNTKAAGVVNTINGSASIQISDQVDNGSSDTITLETLDNFIRKQPLNAADIKLIKIDTDGYDTKILRGATEHLKSVKPVLFFEYDTVLMAKTQEYGLDTLKILRDIGYEDVLFYDNLGRFIVSLPLSNFSNIEQMHNYIQGYKAPFTYYDLCVFHADDRVLAQQFIISETQHQISQ